MAAFPTTVATDSDLYIAVNATSTQLTDNPLTSGATTVNVIDTTAFPTVGFISIDNEIIKYTGKTGTSFTGCTRGADGTSATSHVQNSQVFHNVIAAHHNSVKDDLIATEQFISDLIGRSTTQIKAPAGSASVPSISFAGDLNTGLYNPGADTISLVTGGGARVTIENAFTSLLNVGLLTDGNAASPALTFSADTDTGIYRAATNTLGFTAGGGVALTISTTALTGSSPYLTSDGTAAAPSFSFATDTDSGIFKGAANQVNITTGGTSRLAVSSVDVSATVPFDAPDGSASSPSYSFNNDLNTGIYRSGTDTIDFTTAGTQAVSINSSQQLNMHSHKIISLANGTASSDAAAFGQIFTGFQAPVHATTTTDSTFNTTSFVATNLTASMTLTNSAHRVRVWASGQSRNNTAGGQNFFAIFRDTTNTDDATNGQMAHKVTTSQDTVGMTLLGVISPGDTSSHSYTVYARTNGTGTGHFIDSATAHIILEEIV